jgi:putative ABC transport system substrate-binding protein
VVDNSSQETLEADLKRIAAANPDVIIATSVNIALAAQKATSTIPVIFGGCTIRSRSAWSRRSHGRAATSPGSPRSCRSTRSGWRSSSCARPAHAWSRSLPTRSGRGNPTSGKSMRAALERHGIELRILVIETEATLQRYLASAPGRSVDFWYVPHTKLPFESPDLVVQALAQAHKPAIYERSSYVEKGGMIAYQSDLDDVFEIWATLVDRVLDGVPAAIIPVERPRHFELAVNLASARRLGVVIPRSIITRADRFY